MVVCLSLELLCGELQHSAWRLTWSQLSISRLPAVQSWVACHTMTLICLLDLELPSVNWKPVCAISCTNCLVLNWLLTDFEGWYLAVGNQQVNIKTWCTTFERPFFSTKPLSPVNTIQPVVHRLSNRFDNWLYRVYKHWTGCQTRLTTGLTNGCIVYTAGCTTRFDNRLNEQ